MKGLIISLTTAVLGAVIVFLTISDSSNTDIVKSIDNLHETFKQDSALKTLNDEKYRNVLNGINSIYSDAYKGQKERGIHILPAPLNIANGKKVGIGESVELLLSSGGSAFITPLEVQKTLAVVNVDGKITQASIGTPISISKNTECLVTVVKTNIYETPRFVEVRAQCQQ